jgi:hypothetical protein
VRDARIEARYAGVSARVGSDGRARLGGVLLRMGEAPTPTSVGRAVEVEAPSYAPPPGERRPAEPVEGSEGRRWRLEVVLVPYGQLRLLVQPTQLPDVKARVVADPLLGLAVAEDGIAVARPGQPATWRIFDGPDKVEVRVSGATGVALRRRMVEVPSAGFTREIEIVAEKAVPIQGRVRLPSGNVPDLAGQIRVYEVTDEGDLTRLPYDVTVAPDGTFEVPFTAEARYRLAPELDFADAEPVTARGGDAAVAIVARPRPWLDLHLGGTDAEGRTALFEATRISEDEAWKGGYTRPLPGGARIALPGPGAYRIDVRVGGAEGKVPLEARASVEVSKPGGRDVSLALQAVEAGRVVVSGLAAPANLRLLEPLPSRTRTWLPDADAGAVFENVRAGPVRVRVRWSDEGTAIRFLGGVLQPGGTLEFEAAPVPGRRIVLAAQGDGVWRDSRDRFVAWDEGGVEGRIRCRRVAGLPRWESVDPLAPGRRSVRVHPAGEDGTVEAERTIDVEAGGAAGPVVLPIEVP